MIKSNQDEINVKTTENLNSVKTKPVKKRKINARVQQGLVTKQKLYDSAFRLFSQHDFDDVSVEDITRDVGVTKGTFYVHFPSKDALIAELIREFTNKTDTQYRKAIQTIPEHVSTRDKILQLTEAIVDEIRERIGHAQMKKIYEMMLMGTYNMKPVVGDERDLFLMFQDIIQEGVEKNEVVCGISVHELVKHLIISLRACVFDWCVQYPDVDLKAHALMQMELMTKGMIQ